MQLGKHDRQVDEALATSLFDTLQISMLTLSGLLVACVVLPWVTFVVPFIFVFMLRIR